VGRRALESGFLAVSVLDENPVDIAPEDAPKNVGDGPDDTENHDHETDEAQLGSGIDMEADTFAEKDDDESDDLEDVEEGVEIANPAELEDTADDLLALCQTLRGDDLFDLGVREGLDIVEAQTVEYADDASDDAEYGDDVEREARVGRRGHWVSLLFR